MSYGNAVAGRTEHYRPEQVAVAIQHLPVVVPALEQSGVTCNESERSELLGLALLDLPELAKTVFPIRQNPDLMAKATAARRSSGLDENIQDLDLLMFTLRRRFAEAYNGWTPTMGKNRIVGSVEGLPEISGGSAGDPEPLSPDEAQTAAKSFQLRHAAAGPGLRTGVGVLDTRLVVRGELQGRFVVTEDTLTTPQGSSPSQVGHAAFVAGLIAKQAPETQLDVRWVLSDDQATATVWDTATRMVSFLGSGVGVLNLSLGCLTGDGEEPLVLATAVDQLTPEIVLVAAAGNHGDPQAPGMPSDAPMWPAADHRVIAVGAHTRNGTRARFSPDAPWVQLTAPGVNVTSLYLDGLVNIGDQGQRRFHGFARWSGTSFAAARVSGEIAAHARRTGKSTREALDELLQASPSTDEDIQPVSHQ
jgi:hypothetical protein